MGRSGKQMCFLQKVGKTEIPLFFFRGIECGKKIKQIMETEKGKSLQKMLLGEKEKIMKKRGFFSKEKRDLKKYGE